MPFIKIDEKEFEVAKGITVLQAALANGIEIPHYCFHPVLEVVGSCRMCLVQVEGMPKLQASCNTSIGEVALDKKLDGKYDMVVNTQTDAVKQERKNILEFLLLNHPLDCPVCDQAGECYLQDYTFKYGNAHSRFKEEKRVRPSESLGSNIVINQDRCILCSRCVRFTREISGTNELFVQNRGYHSKVSILKDKPLENLMAGNVADICPVGALLNTDYIHKNRFWNLDTIPSVCQDCSAGCNVDVFSQRDEIFRLTPRENHDVNGYFMCDIGRYGFHRFEEIERVNQPLVRNGKSFDVIDWAEAIQKTADLIEQSNGKTAGIVSPFHTNESNFLLGLMINGMLGMLPAIQAEEITYPSGFRISADRSPNQRGMNNICGGLAEDLSSEIKTQAIRGLYILDDGVDRELDDAWKEILAKMDFLIVQSYAMTDLAKLAHIVLPGLAPYEREGTITNDQDRIQWLRPSLSIKAESKPDWEILMLVNNALNKKAENFTGLDDVIIKMGEQFPNYSGITLFKIATQGIALNGKKM
ncbi:MAG: molybdopterin-dependent oxidoreductase [Candidatus Marinimicrobia bacterium]|jgi:NADH-quinone oxidoreductase subunit G|nr:molybdopterin-dependent oxidoreductase [Candidatus Neomarinimicrobiota bacterium]MDP6610886.1 molybdopterin-dependent oxidoreductase [Candidatus Neomarinimicrobiota bacterium]|tara:strand:- start:2718 stop:4304 length:1587 start_codon:yes stop_codon:yes gene_type:complete